MGPKRIDHLAAPPLIFTPSARSFSRWSRLDSLIYVHFQFGLSPLEHYYLPYYLRTEIGRLSHIPLATINCFTFPIARSRPRTALEADVEPGETPQPTGGPLPLVLSSEARRRLPLHSARTAAAISNKALHTWIGHWIYAEIPLPALQDATLFLALAPSASASIFRSQGYPAHQGTSLRAPPQRARSRERQGVHRSSRRQRHRHHDER